jgi:uncharacterized protein (TIGR00369 family)
MLTDDNRCFACGRENKEGLQLEFTYPPGNGKAETRFTPSDKYQGWQGFVHGGILVTLLDEVMAKAAAQAGFRVLTGEITAKFKQPACVAEPLRCEAQVENVRKKIVYASAAVFKEDGTIVAQATSKMFISAKQ